VGVGSGLAPGQIAEIALQPDRKNAVRINAIIALLRMVMKTPEECCEL
jgi:hypothetical protein